MSPSGCTKAPKPSQFSPPSNLGRVTGAVPTLHVYAMCELIELLVGNQTSHSRRSLHSSERVRQWPGPVSSPLGKLLQGAIVTLLRPSTRRLPPSAIHGYGRHLAHPGSGRLTGSPLFGNYENAILAIALVPPTFP
jgi:hypothetical protein